MAFGFGTNIIGSIIRQQGMPKGKPRDVEAPKIEKGDVIKENVKVSQQNLAAITELVRGLNQVVSSEAFKLAESFIPGFNATQRDLMNVAAAYARGEQPRATTEALRRESAALAQSQGVPATLGVPGGFGQFGHLGRTREQVERGFALGSDLANQATVRARAFAPQFANPLSFLFTPQQAADIERFNEISRFNVESANAIKDWLPSMRTTAMWNAVADDFDATISTVASAFTGGALGGMGGMMGGMGGAGGGAGGAGAGGGGGGWQGFLNLFGGGGGGSMGTDSFGTPMRISRDRPNYG